METDIDIVSRFTIIKRKRNKLAHEARVDRLGLSVPLMADSNTTLMSMRSVHALHSLPLISATYLIFQSLHSWTLCSISCQVLVGVGGRGR